MQCMGCVYSGYQIILGWLWEYLYRFLFSSSTRKYDHYLGFGHESSVCAVCLFVMLWYIFTQAIYVEYCDVKRCFGLVQMRAQAHTKQIFYASSCCGLIIPILITTYIARNELFFKLIDAILSYTSRVWSSEQVSNIFENNFTCDPAAL